MPQPGQVIGQLTLELCRKAFGYKHNGHINVFGVSTRLQKRHNWYLRNTQCVWCKSSLDRIEIFIPKRGNPNKKGLIRFMAHNGYQLTMDHIIPRCEYGSNALKNMQCLCEFCNQMKGGSPPGSRLYTWRQTFDLITNGSRMACTTWSREHHIFLEDGALVMNRSHQSCKMIKTPVKWEYFKRLNQKTIFFYEVQQRVS